MMLPIPLPWLIVGVLVSLFGTYRVGHHYGWLERDNDMKIAIAQKNEESRKTEQQLNEQINQNATKLLEATNAINQKTSDTHSPTTPSGSCTKLHQLIDTDKDQEQNKSHTANDHGQLLHFFFFLFGCLL